MCRVFVANLTLAYWVTGLSKLFSPYWKQGIALCSALQLNICQSQGWWGIDWLPWLKPFNYAAVAVECLLHLVFLLRVGHPLRLLGFCLALGLHGGIIVTIGVRYANLCWILAWLMVLREEVAQWMGWARSAARLTLTASTRYAIMAVSFIAQAMSEGVPGLGFALHWSIGLSQAKRGWLATWPPEWATAR